MGSTVLVLGCEIDYFGAGFVNVSAVSLQKKIGKSLSDRMD